MDKIKVLVVDDESRMRKLVHDFLSRSNYEVIEAADGEEAIDIFYADKSISLIILDVMMPKMDGIAAVGRIKEIDDNARIIMCSSMGYQEKVVDAITAGAKDFIIKPYEAEKVIKSVKAVLKLDKE